MSGAKTESSVIASDRVPSAILTPSHGMLFDLDYVDANQRILDKEALQAWIPHRGQMQLLDAVIWTNEPKTQGLGYRFVRDDEFWVEGHFPAKPLFPGVLMVETGAQLALYLFNARSGTQKIPVFLRIEECAFRKAVEPGAHFYVLCQEIKMNRRRFVSQVQGLVDGQITFEAKLTGMTLGTDDT